MTGQPSPACATCRLVQALAIATGVPVAVVRITQGITPIVPTPRGATS